MHNDKLIIERIQKGETQAYALLVDKYKNAVFTLAYRTINNNAEAEEIAQDCFLKAFQKLDKFRGDSKFSTWLYRIVYNTSISHVRKKKHDTLSLNDETYNNLDKEDDSYREFNEEELLERKELIHKAIASLPKEDAFLITLFHLEDVPVKEISEITTMSESNVKVKLFRARKKLHSLLMKNYENLLIS